MHRFKKVILSLFLLLAFACCSGINKISNKWFQKNGKLKILTTTAQVGELIKEIGGDQVDVLVLIQGELDPHSYDFVKGDSEKFEFADVIFFNGLGLEHGANIFEYLTNSKKAHSVGEEIKKRFPDLILKNDSVLDPHVWMDISIWDKTIDPVVEILGSYDPLNKDIFNQNARVYHLKLQNAHQNIFNILHSIPENRRYLVTSHDAFEYFTRAYLSEGNEENWHNRFSAPEGLAPDGQLGPKDIQKVILFLKEKNITVIFPESNVSTDSIYKIVQAGKEFGLNLRICNEPLFGDSLGDYKYIEMMEHNAKTLAEHL